MEYKIRANIVMSRNLTVEAEVSRWDRYLGMTAAMTQVPVPTATIRDFSFFSFYLELLLCGHFYTEGAVPTVF